MFCAKLFLAASLTVPPAGAQDTGAPVSFQGRAFVGRHALASSAKSGGVVLETAASDDVAESFDTLLLQGELAGPAALVFEASRQDASGSWSPWTAAELHLYPSGRFWAKVVFPDAREGALRLRVRRLGPASPGDLQVYAMDVHASRAGAPSAPQGPSRPEIVPPEPFPAVIPRSAWGAEPPRETPVLHVPVKMTQHHTAGRQTRTLEESLEEVRFIQDFHQNGRGWSDIGYHFLVDAAGRIFEGRPASVQGAHVRDANAGNVGIVLMGFHHPPYDHPATREELETLRALGRGLISRYGIPKTAYLGHRDQGRTDCPGDIVYGLLDDVRESFAREDGTGTAGAAALEKAAETRSALADGGQDH